MPSLHPVLRAAVGIGLESGCSTHRWTRNASSGTCRCCTRSRTCTACWTLARGPTCVRMKQAVSPLIVAASQLIVVLGPAQLLMPDPPVARQHHGHQPSMGSGAAIQQMTSGLGSHMSFAPARWQKSSTSVRSTLREQPSHVQPRRVKGNAADLTIEAYSIMH